MAHVPEFQPPPAAPVDLLDLWFGDFDSLGHPCVELAAAIAARFTCPSSLALRGAIYPGVDPKHLADDLKTLIEDGYTLYRHRQTVDRLAQGVAA